MAIAQPTVLTDTWVTITWDEFMRVSEDPTYAEAKLYYYNGRMRIEMPPVGNDHSSDHSIVSHAVHLFAGVRGLDLAGKDNCSYRKTGFREVQPDASFYIGETASAIPYGTKVINLDLYPPPTLVIEIADTSLSDDKGEKRLLYEEMGVAEYWIADVATTQVIAFAILPADPLRGIENGGSRRITESAVLPGLKISLLQAALQMTRQTNHGKVGAWLLQQFQQL